MLIKVGNENDAIKVLIDKCENVSEIIELAVRFSINDEMLWDQIILRAVNSTDQIQ